MPWKVRNPVDLRVELIARLRAGERMSDLCREYGISRKTGHKLKKRYEELGATGLLDRSRAPEHIPHKTSPEVLELVIAERRKHPTWGPRKLKVVLEQRLGRALPAASTLGEALARAGLVERRRIRTRLPRPVTGLHDASAPNDVWCADYKGQFRLGNGSYCYPLTITDQFSRYVLACDGMARIDEEQAKESFELAFRTYGLPRYIRSDNGSPFASVGLAGLTMLSAYWMRLGIRPERTQPASPQENGRHERMHRTLKQETTRPARHNLLQQQERFDAFQAEFNHQRPHEALGMKPPARFFRASSRPYPRKLPEPEYPLHDDILEVRQDGFIHPVGKRRVYISRALRGQPIGLREEDNGQWSVAFLELDLGCIEHNWTFTPSQEPKF